MNSHKILSIAATIVFLTPFPVKAQEKIPHWEVAFSTSNQDNPSATQEGKARCQRCFKNPESQVPLTSILPVIDQRLTVASHPTFLINLPETFAKQVFFKIEAHNEEYEYTTILPITGQKGIMRVTLPPDAPALETGQTYQWFLVLMCQDKLKPDSPAVQGSVKRVSTTMTSSEQFQAMSQLQQAAIYAL